MNVLGISGSLRQDSWNHKLLQAAGQILESKGADVEIVGLEHVEMYHPDVERELGYPEGAAAFRDAIDRADAIVIASPEYNSSVPGVLKNAIDWASRSPNVFNDKVVFIMGAGPGRSGAAKMHMHLVSILESIGAWVVPQPHVLLPNVATILAPDGELIDESVGELLDEAMSRLLETAVRLNLPRELAKAA